MSGCGFRGGLQGGTSGGGRDAAGLSIAAVKRAELLDVPPDTASWLKAIGGVYTLFRSGALGRISITHHPSSAAAPTPASRTGISRV